jgi:transposase
MSSTDAGCEVIGGVDTHGRSHHGAVIDAATGRLLGDREFAATAAGYRELLAWLASSGRVRAVGVEGTGSYGAGLFRYLASQGVAVIEVGRPSRRERRLQGKSDPLDAIAAARAVLAETATAIPKSRSGPVEAIRLIRTTRTSAVKARQAAINQMHGLLVSAPEELRQSLAGARRAALVTRCARLRADQARVADPAVAARIALRALASRVQALDAEITSADAQLAQLVSRAAPATLAVSGAGPETAAQLLTTAGDNPHRLHSEAALARLCGAAPIPASSGNITRHRLHRGGDRAANRALYLIVLNRLRWHAPTRAYVQRRTAEGKTKKEIIRCLKRALIRELYTTLTSDLKTPAPALDSP